MIGKNMVKNVIIALLGAIILTLIVVNINQYKNKENPVKEIKDASKITIVRKDTQRTIVKSEPEKVLDQNENDKGTTPLSSESNSKDMENRLNIKETDESIRPDLLKPYNKEERIEAERRSRQFSIDNKYNELYGELKLENEELEKFKRLLAIKDTVETEVNIDLGPGASWQDKAKRTKELYNEIEGSIQTLLGGKNYSEYVFYRDTLKERKELSDFVKLLDSDNQIDDHQKDNLILELFKARKEYESLNESNKYGSSAPDNKNPVIYKYSQIYERYISAASKILSEPQMEVFKKSLKQNLDSLEKALNNLANL